jgi:hypothetical protein
MMPFAWPMRSRVRNAVFSCRSCWLARIARGGVRCQYPADGLVLVAPAHGFEPEEVECASGPIGSVELERQPAEDTGIHDGGGVLGPSGLGPKVVGANDGIGERRLNARTFTEGHLKDVELVRHRAGGGEGVKAAVILDHQNARRVDSVDQVHGS